MRMMDEYRVISGEGGRSYLRSGKLDELESIDAVIFDCDGVLIDARGSYDAAIMMTVDRVVREMFNLRLPWRRLAPPLVQKLRQTGGFNNDWDSSYALVAFALLSLQAGRLGAPQTVARRGRREIAKGIAESIDTFAASERTSGRASVDSFLRARLSSRYESFARSLKMLGYPGNPPDSFLTTVFDEAYFGPSLYRRIYASEPRYGYQKGLIDRERVLLSKSDLNRVRKVVGKSLSIITGRPYLGTKHTLGATMDYFDRKASVFIGDLDLDPALASSLEKFRKPSAAGLMHSRDALSSKVPLYVGDSGEDIMMVENARRLKERFLFAGTYGTSFDPHEQVEFFRRSGADLILPAARSLPRILERAKKNSL